MKKNRILYAAVAAAFGLMGVYVAFQRFAPAPAAPAAQGTSAAVGQLLTQSFKDAAGQPQSLDQYRGKPLIVNFWATWCAPCVDEMPELSALQQEVAASGVRIIGIGVDSPANIAEFSAKYKISYPLYVGGMAASDLSRQLGNQAGGLPFTVLISPAGEVKKAYLGRLKMAELRRELGRL